MMGRGTARKCRSKFGKLVHLVDFIIKKFVTMHGHIKVNKIKLKKKLHLTDMQVLGRFGISVFTKLFSIFIRLRRTGCATAEWQTRKFERNSGVIL